MRPAFSSIWASTSNRGRVLTLPPGLAWCSAWYMLSIIADRQGIVSPRRR
jgi:hypothetical protein